ncbi:unnamed protein product, partial [Phaeothamnion confervicola]
FLIGASRRNPDDVRLDPTTDVLRSAVHDLVQGTNVLKIKIYDTHGRTIFSTDPKQIGADYSKNERFLGAMAGRTASELEKRDKFQAINGEMKNIWVLSSYIAIRPSGAAGEIVGVAETYTDVTEFQAQLDNTGSLLVGTSAIVLLAIFIFLAAIVWIAERVMHRQHAN